MDKLRVLMIGAHPDDPDSKGGGTAALYAKAGHVVKLVSLTNGDAGHMSEGGAPLAWRRRAEAANVGKVLGVEYITLDNHDGMLMPTLDVRNEVIALVREFRPDIVFSPRIWDYHPDHRACGQVVMDALYMCTVPNVVSNVPHLRRMPVAMLFQDHFQSPYPSRPDVVVDITPVWEQKLDGLHEHTSQMYEWLPYNREGLHEVPEGDAARRAWLHNWYDARIGRLVDLYKPQIIAKYGAERAATIKAVETFEVSEYGSPLTPELCDKFFPF